MSIVLSYVDKNKAIMGCDGLVVNSAFEPINQNYKKIHKINQNILVGYAGELNSCEFLVNFLRNQTFSDIISSMYVEDVVAFFNSCFQHYNVDKAGFLVSGISKRQQLCSASIASYSVQKIDYIKANIVYNGLYPEEISRDENLFKKHIIKQQGNIRKAMFDTIREVSERSPSVNNVCYLEEVVL